MTHYVDRAGATSARGSVEPILKHSRPAPADRRAKRSTLLSVPEQPNSRPRSQPCPNLYSDGQLDALQRLLPLRDTRWLTVDLVFDISMRVPKNLPACHGINPGSD